MCTKLSKKIMQFSFKKLYFTYKICIHENQQLRLLLHRAYVFIIRFTIIYKIKIYCFYNKFSLIFGDEQERGESVL